MGVGLSKPKEESKEGPVDGESENNLDDSDNDSSGEDSEKNTSKTIWGGEKYAQRRERNIAENKKLLE